MGNTKTAAHHPDDLARAEQLLSHFEELEAQFQAVRDGLTHSHRLATLGTIASIIAHEYNNILTPVISYAQLALDRPDDREFGRKALEKAMLGAQRAAQISSSLLGFARDADEKRHAARLPQVVQDALTCLARDPRKDGIELEVDVPDVLVAMAPVHLQQVLLNLLLNARQALRGRKGRLRISAQVQARLVHLQVADNGPGIPEAIKDRLFEPFVSHRLTEAAGDSSERKGTGLGLCICRDLVRNAGGTIRVESVSGQGAAFYITLPKADDLFEVDIKPTEA